MKAVTLADYNKYILKSGLSTSSEAIDENVED
jgi:hypothetical protein